MAIFTPAGMRNREGGTESAGDRGSKRQMSRHRVERRVLLSRGHSSRQPRASGRLGGLPVRRHGLQGRDVTEEELIAFVRGPENIEIEIVGPFVGS